jgi:riboflavin synthase
MFTGLVEGTGEIKRISRTRGDMTLSILPHFDMSDCRTGESICVDGVCLTVTGIRQGAFNVDASGETISRTTFGSLREGSRVNLERSLRLTDRLGGHLVSGHVDGVGKLLKRVPQQRSWFFRIGIPQNLSRYTIEKGSIAVDGISLTINRCHSTYFEVNIIPETARVTTILMKKVGDPVNVEMDMIGKYVEKFLLTAPSKEERRAGGITEEMLQEYGFGD